MKVFALVVLLAVATQALDLSIVDEINAKNAGWVAGVNPMFKHASVAEVKRMLGWKPNPVLKASLPVGEVPDVEVPASFNSVTNWANCTQIGSIKNQGSCGSCWAFGATQMASDRFCIASGGKFQDELSEQQLTSCGPCNGCEGGDAGAAQEFIHENGLTTSSCYPYTEPTCKPSQQPCEPPFSPTKPCHQVTNSSCKAFHVGRPYSVGSFLNRADDIAKEIVAHGTVEACFTVYEDFIHYKSGVYKHTSGGVLGGHCVSPVGFGTENGEPYWLIKNSWTTAWGDNGYFKILRGHDECGIESDVVAAMAMLS